MKASRSRSGFTANLNVELALATLQETVTVTGASPIIDTTATRVQQNFKLEQLQSIPNGRDMWSLLAVTPAVQMSRIDVGGNRAGTQTGYTAYGFTGQVRVLIEGINTTEGTGGAGFYFDYSSLEEVFLGTSGQSAEMPNPGVQSQFIAKSGGNQFSGEDYLDWYNNSLQGTNIPDVHVRSRATADPRAAATRSTATTTPPSTSAARSSGTRCGGSAPTASSSTRSPSRTSNSTRRSTPSCGTRSARAPTRPTRRTSSSATTSGARSCSRTACRSGTYIYTRARPDLQAGLGQLGVEGRMERHAQRQALRRGPLRRFRLLLPDHRQQRGGLLLPRLRHAGDRRRARKWQTRSRPQAAHRRGHLLPRHQRAAATPSSSAARSCKERRGRGFQQGVGGNIEHVYNNGRSNQVIFCVPDRDRDAGSLAPARTATPTSATPRRAALFLNDTWSRPLDHERRARATIATAAACRSRSSWRAHGRPHGDHRRPDVRRNSSCTPGTRSRPRVGVGVRPERRRPDGGQGATTASSGTTPASASAANANPNQPSKKVTYTWNDINRDRRWQPGEQGACSAPPSPARVAAGSGHRSAVHARSQRVLRAAAGRRSIGVRGGFVYKTEDDLIETLPAAASAVEATRVPFTFVDIGLDGVRGTADDRNLTMLGLPSAQASQFPRPRW